MYKFVFEIPVEELGSQLQRLVNAEKMADPYNDENCSFSFDLPKEWSGSAAVTWKTRQNLMAKAILKIMDVDFVMDLA